MQTSCWLALEKLLFWPDVEKATRSVSQVTVLTDSVLFHQRFVSHLEGKTLVAQECILANGLQVSKLRFSSDFPIRSRKAGVVLEICVSTAVHGTWMVIISDSNLDLIHSHALCATAAAHRLQQQPASA